MRGTVGADGKITVTDTSFGCMTQLKPVRGFFVGGALTA
jgi:hypothetical protein